MRKLIFIATMAFFIPMQSNAQFFKKLIKAAGEVGKAVLNESTNNSTTDNTNSRTSKKTTTKDNTIAVTTADINAANVMNSLLNKPTTTIPSSGSKKSTSEEVDTKVEATYKQ